MKRRRVIVGIALLLVAVCVAAYLLSRGLPRNMSLLHFAASGGRTCVINASGDMIDGKSDAAGPAGNEGLCNLLASVLLTFGSGVNSRDEDGWTPLHWAVWAGRPGMVAPLVKRGADVSASAEPMTPEMADVDIIGPPGTLVLWEARAKRTRRTPLDVLVAFDRGQCTAALLDRGLDPSVALDETEGRNLLHTAALAGATQVTEVLLERGASVDAGDKQGWTALHYAAAGRWPDVVRVLLQYDADVALATTGMKRPWVGGIREEMAAGSTSLHLAALARSAKAAEALLAAGAAIEARDADGRTPLHQAAGRAASEVVALLLSSGADAHATDRGGVTPLHLAAGVNGVNAVKLLLDSGADADARDASGLTPLDYARPLPSGHDDVVGLLERYTEGQ